MPVRLLSKTVTVPVNASHTRLTMNAPAATSKPLVEANGIAVVAVSPSPLKRWVLSRAEPVVIEHLPNPPVVAKFQYPLALTMTTPAEGAVMVNERTVSSTDVTASD